jgi:3-oxoadipate enol-lactonase
MLSSSRAATGPRGVKRLVTKLTGRVMLAAVLIAAERPADLAAQPAAGTSAAGIFYEVSGKGEPVVLIHGFSLDRRVWQPQMTVLETRFRVIRYDLRGHGKSAAPSEPYAPYEDLRSVLDALGIARATLIGHSAGGELAIDFALAYPDRVSRLVLAAPGLSGYTPKEPLAWVLPVFQAAAAGDLERATTLWIDTPIMRLTRDVMNAPTVAGIVRDNSRIWSVRTNPARPLAPPAIQRLAQIARPTLILVGERDLPHIHDIVKRLSAGIAGSRVVVLPGAGHLLTIDAAAAFNEAIAAFLASQ